MYTNTRVYIHIDSFIYDDISLSNLEQTVNFNHTRHIKLYISIIYSEDNYYVSRIINADDVIELNQYRPVCNSSSVLARPILSPPLDMSLNITHLQCWPLRKSN